MRVGLVEKKAVPLQIRNVGTVQAYVAVSVRAQVTGEIMEVHFREGQDLKKGELLFSIDPRPYEAALAQAEAALARERAQMENAQTDVKRYEDLVKKDYVTQQQYDSVKANAAATAANVRSDQAARGAGAPGPRVLLDPRADRRAQRQHPRAVGQRREGQRRRARHDQPDRADLPDLRRARARAARDPAAAERRAASSSRRRSRRAAGRSAAAR